MNNPTGFIILKTFVAVLLHPGRSGAAGEAGQVALLPPSDPPAEQPDLPSVPGAGPNPTQPARRLPRRQVRSGLERQREGEARNLEAGLRDPRKGPQVGLCLLSTGSV